MRFAFRVSLLFIICFSERAAFADSLTDSLLAVIKTTSSQYQQSTLLLKISESVTTTDSIIYYNKLALDVANKINNDSLRLACYRNLVRSYQQKPFAEDSALIYIPLIDKINRENNFVELAFLSNAAIATLYVQLHQYDDAIKYSQQSLDAAKISGDLKRISRAKNNLGEIYRKASLFEQAKEVFKEATEIAINSNDLPNIISGYRGIAICYDMTKDFINAEKYFQLALGYASKDKSDKTMYSPLGNLAVAQWHLKKYDDAIINLNQAVVIAKKYNLIQIQSDYKNLADVYKDKGDYDSSVYYGNLSLALAEKNNEKLLQNIDHKILAEAYKLKGDYKLAVEHMQRSFEISDSLKMKEKEKAIAEVEASYRNKEIKSRIELLNKENEIHKLKLQEKETALYYSKIKAEQAENQIALLNKNKDLQSIQLVKSQQELANRKLQSEAKSAELELAKKDSVLNEKQLTEQRLLRNLIVVASLSLIVVGLLLFNRFRLRKQLENQMALTTQRKQISADLHDDIGATLSSISIYSEALKNKYKQGDYANATALAEKIGANSREMMDSMSDIVWAINPGHDSLQQLFDRMSSFALMLLSEKNIQCKFDFDEVLFDMPTPMEVRKNIYLIFKECINNIAKYADCKNVIVQIKKTGNHIVMNVIDNGKGFETSHTAAHGKLGGNGIKNMQQRAHEINATFEINSVIDKGTTVVLKYPLIRG